MQDEIVDEKKVRAKAPRMTYPNEFSGSLAPSVGGTMGDFGRNIVRFMRWFFLRPTTPQKQAEHSRLSPRV